MTLLTLIAKRVKETQGIYKGFNKTEFYLNSLLKMTIQANCKQPRKDKKYINYNCFKYILQFQ